MKKIISYKNNQGFTLIELLLYISLLAFMMLAISVFVSTLVESRVKNQVINDVEQQGTQAMQIITQTIRNSSAINSPASGASATSLSLAVAAPNDPTVFSLNSGVLQISEAGGAAVALTNDRVTVSDLTFTNLSRASTPGIVRIQFTITYNNLGGQYQYDYNKIFYASAARRAP